MLCPQFASEKIGDEGAIGATFKVTDTFVTINGSFSHSHIRYGFVIITHEFNLSEKTLNPQWANESAYILYQFEFGIFSLTPYVMRRYLLSSAE
jgi:hypothetical protein